MSNVTDGTSKKGGAFLAQLWAKHKKLSKSQRNHQYAVFERDSENADLILKKMWWFIGVFCKFLLILRYCFFLSTGVKTSEYCETVEFNVRATFSRFLFNDKVFIKKTEKKKLNDEMLWYLIKVCWLRDCTYFCEELEINFELV